MGDKMSLSEYQRSQGAWAIICWIFMDGFLEYETTVTPWVINPSFIEGTKIVPIYHPAWLPIEWLPYFLIIWFIGHAFVWAINKFR
jgi:hypothetical protein